MKSFFAASLSVGSIVMHWHTTTIRGQNAVTCSAQWTRGHGYSLCARNRRANRSELEVTTSSGGGSRNDRDDDVAVISLCSSRCNAFTRSRQRNAVAVMTLLSLYSLLLFVTRISVDSFFCRRILRARVCPQRYCLPSAAATFSHRHRRRRRVLRFLADIIPRRVHHVVRIFVVVLVHCARKTRYTYLRRERLATDFVSAQG